jgi:hypothetical protein
LFNSKNDKIVKNQKIDYNLILVGAVIFGAIYIFRKIGSAGSGFLSGLGITNTEAENQILTEFQNENYWNFNEFLSNMPAGGLLLTQSYAANLVNQLWDATGFFNDDEEAIYGVFRSLKTKSQVAALAKKFYELKGQDLYSYLKNYLNDSEMLVLSGIVDQKPKYNI